ncbi:hypothetical protein GGI15_004554 [Coemansia interrupta]|uniref:Uncharacterized protein n=1 Tax=Coemansia interrupta TaxID=1126814 RepID=A0A9W8H2L8_9FUNG|nr:hypothetical protein GGI15_004554 [Coemansia interrupta]
MTVEAPVSAPYTFEFCPADNAIAPRCMLLYYYHNSANHTNFMDFTLLKHTFHQTLLASLPLALATSVSMDAPPLGKLTAFVNPRSPKYPEVKRHTDHEHTIKNMVARGFARGSQPPVLANMRMLADPLAGDALAMLEVVYMADGVGLAVGLSHAVVDITGFRMFVEQWSRLCRSTVHAELPQYKAQKLYIDRTEFWRMVTKEPAPPPSPFDRHLEELAGCPESSADRQVSEQEPSATYRITVPDVLLEQLAKSRRPADPQPSVPALLSAILWKALVRAQPSPHPQFAYFANSLTVRPLHKSLAAFCGNAVTMKYIHMPVAHLLHTDTQDVAVEIHRAAREFTGGQFARIIRGYMEPQGYMGRLARFVENGRAPRLMVSNVSRAGLYDEADFGWSGPEKIVFPADIPQGLCIFLPMSSAGGIDAYLCTTRSVIESIAQDDQLKDHIAIYEQGPE